MVLSNQKAFDILGLPVGSDLSSISTKYKQLAIKWHPEKHKHSEESQQKFKQVTLAYKRLASPGSQQDLTMRQRERRRLEKEQKSNPQTKSKKDKKVSMGTNRSSKINNSSSEDDSTFDPNSAFFTKVVSKKKKNTLIVDVNPSGKKEKSHDKKSDEEAEEIVDPTVLRSRQLAIRGNEMAQVDQYTAAIQLFTEAISLDPTDFRFFGNRSYCYDRIEQYENPTNPEGLTALWVGNVLPSVTEKRLNQLFSKFGQVTSVRPLPEKYCAFINFKTKEAAGRAMHQLQGTEVDGQKLLIKFPDNPLTSTTAGTLTIRKNMSNGANKQGVRNTPKQTGPVNGDECYFWRTTGCTFGSDCKWQHYPKSKGIDRKPWQK
ncbi:tetratricopeptide repeat protein 31 [Elysia marginata]|uniref:Tetratricopeptide repeat protein 31 n=1 Tax=Elysia marginata TaxID=1093978 RepID=A0AAV4FDE4_9GAST|nr:tetratricopeptide repeat protein 31 [Elysia marginata]